MTGLAGKRVLVTRAEDDAQAWADALRAAGAVPIVLPCIACEPIDDDTQRDRLAAAVAAADWLALTSRRGVAAVAAMLAKSLPAALRIAVVGPATAEAARESFGRVDLVSTGGNAVDLAVALIERLRADSVAGAPVSAPPDGGMHLAQPAVFGEGSASSTDEIASRGSARPRVIAAVAENAATTLETALRGAGIDCERIDVYRTLPAPRAVEPTTLSALGAECILLASPSAVVGLTHRVTLDRDVEVYTLGPSTSAAARARGLVVTAQAREPTLTGLMEVMQCVN